MRRTTAIRLKRHSTDFTGHIEDSYSASEDSCITCAMALEVSLSKYHDVIVMSIKVIYDRDLTFITKSLCQDLEL